MIEINGQTLSSKELLAISKGAKVCLSATARERMRENAANVPNVASGTGVAAVTSAGICGFLIGPPAIGFIGESYGLNYGLGIVAILSILAFLF